MRGRVNSRQKQKSAYVFIKFLQPLLRLSECPITVAKYAKTQPHSLCLNKVVRDYN